MLGMVFKYVIGGKGQRLAFISGTRLINPNQLGRSVHEVVLGSESWTCSSDSSTVGFQIVPTFLINPEVWPVWTKNPRNDHRPGKRDSSGQPF